MRVEEKMEDNSPETRPSQFNIYDTMDDETVSTAEQFKSATSYVSLNPNLFSSEQLLHFYARYKQVKDGICNTSKPGMFDFQGKQKWEAWKKLGNMPKSQAMEEYVKYLAELVPEWHLSSSNNIQSQSGGSWVSVSTMTNPDADLAEENKTAFDWCKEGNTQRVKTFVKKGAVAVNEPDENGMTLLHWACDRGNVDMVKVLLGLKANINAQDVEKQTPLHYAVSCEHCEVVRLLLSHGADKSIKDCDGCAVTDLETNKEIQHILAS